MTSVASTSPAATVSARIVRAFSEVARKRGADVEAVLRSHGVDPSILDDPEGRISLATEWELWEAMAAAVGEDFFGLHAQRDIAPGSFDVLDFAVRSSANLVEAWQTIVRLLRLIHDTSEIELDVSGDTAQMIQRFRGTPLSTCRQGNDFVVGGMMQMTRDLIGDDWMPRAIQLMHAAPDNCEPYRDFFGVMPEFECESNAIVVAKELLDRKVVSANPLLNVVLQRHGDALLEQLPIATDIVQEAREAITRNLFGGDVSVERVAWLLHLSPRTLQRRLAKAGTSHQQLLESIRRDTALWLLDREGVTIADVAAVLGYSQPSAFHRAFKRWTGVSPTAARKPATGSGDTGSQGA